MRRINRIIFVLLLLVSLVLSHKSLIKQQQNNITAIKKFGITLVNNIDIILSKSNDVGNLLNHIADNTSEIFDPIHKFYTKINNNKRQDDVIWLKNSTITVDHLYENFVGYLTNRTITTDEIKNYMRDIFNNNTIQKNPIAVLIIAGELNPEASLYREIVKKFTVSHQQFLNSTGLV